MALGSALVDRARFVRRKQTATEIDGEKQWRDTDSALLPSENLFPDADVVPDSSEENQWFRCRLQMVKGSEQQQDGRRRRVVRPTIIVGRKAVIKKGDKIEVKSKQQFEGTKVFTIDGDPEPLRKRRTVIGYEATLAKPE